MRQVVILLFTLSVSLSAIAQAVNDKIAHRIQLVPDAGPVHSTTAKSTVEWDCLNKALTNKCLVYHNDQWYTFSVAEPSRYYLNISSQQCRDNRGIQMILIEGNPCETTSYRVLACIPQIRDSEVFVSLGEIKAGTTYLVEIDGFLGDQCDFDIQVSRRPVGMPLQKESYVKAEFEEISKFLRDSIVTIDWKLPEDWMDELDVFRVYRLTNRENFKIERIVDLTRNAYGRPNNRYHLTDTVSQSGTYRYRVFGYAKTGKTPVLLAEQHIVFQKSNVQTDNTQNILIDPGFQQKGGYETRVYDRDGIKLLKTIKGVYDPADHKAIVIDVTEQIAAGFQSFLVLLIDEVTHQSRELYFRVNSKGKVISE